MEPSTVVNIILSMTVLVLLIFITVKLFIRMRETKLSNLKWLIGVFACQALIGLTKVARIEIAFYIVAIVSNLFIIIFTEETFYKDRKSPFKIIVVLALLLAALIFTLVIAREIDPISFYLLDTYLLTILIVISSLWLASAAFSAYGLIKDDNISELIKTRYRILGIASLILAVQGFITPIHTVNQKLIQLDGGVQLYTIVNASILLVFAFASFYAWVILGKKIEQSIDKTSEKEISEEEMMKMIKEAK
jgi:hypothetical protein